MQYSDTVPYIRLMRLKKSTTASVNKKKKKNASLLCHLTTKSVHTVCTSDVWLTVHCNSVWIRNQLDVTLCYPLFLLYKLLNMFRATMCPSSGADDCVVLSPRVGIVLWLQNRLAGSVSIEEFVARTPQWTHYLLTGSDSLTAATAQYQHVAITLRSRQLLKMGTWLPETCWATYKWENKVLHKSDI